MKLSAKIERIMLEKGLSQQALSDLLRNAGAKVSQRAVSNWLHGTQPRADALKALADLAGMPVELLADDTKSLPFAEHLAQASESTRTALAEHRDNLPAARSRSDYLDLKNANRRQAAAILTAIRELATVGRELDNEDTRFDILLAAVRGDVDSAITPQMHEVARQRALAAGAGRRPRLGVEGAQQKVG